MSLIYSFLPPLAYSCSQNHTNTIPKLKSEKPNLTPKKFLPNLLSLAIAVTLTSPLPSHAIPSLNSQSPSTSLTTPFSQSKSLLIGLENGYVNIFFQFVTISLLLMISYYRNKLYILFVFNSPKINKI